jgi:ABC-type transport system involved in cytochrome bd biosynthesis fused ATPase/permease subunit
MTDASKSGQRAVAENPIGVDSATIFETLIKDRNIHELGLEFSLREIQCNLGNKLHPILQGISGRITKGRLFGILGPSGAGKCKFTIPDTAALCAKAQKATFINILAGRSKPTYGSISINGVSGDPTKSVQC